jgi:hypothetical protein
MHPVDCSTNFVENNKRSSSVEEFGEVFQNPPAELRGKPFWSWNGALERDELLRQIDVLREMGMGGMFMHSRTGLQTEYLGEEWFELVNACAEKAERVGMEGWIYDEDRWPSGSAGGMATKEPTFRMRSIVLSEYGPGEAIEWPETSEFLEAHLADLDGLCLRHYEPLPRSGIRVCPEGKRVLVLAREIHPDHSFYNGGSYLDTLNREATDHFIELTHEKYRKRCGQHFGKGIKGVFTDEPHRGFILCDTVNQPGAKRSSHALPYTEKLYEEFVRRFGYSLKGRLPELFFQLEGKAVSQLKWHYVELLQQLFIENWARPCLQWCEANDLLLTGHVLHEDSLAAQVVPCGSIFRYYEEMTYPGIDVLGSQNQAFWVAKQVVSVARQQGKPFVLSELYGCTGWATSFLDHKRIGDWQAVLGVNLRCHHLSWYTMAGEAKRDYPASIFHQSAWYRDYDYVETYFARIHYVLRQGEPDCDVLVVHPGESLWAQFHLGWASWLRSDSPRVNAIEETFERLFGWLTDSQIDFDYGDEEQMGRLGRIETDGEKPLFRLGLMGYRVVVVAGMETMRASTMALLGQFIEAGGTVVFVGESPTFVDAKSSGEPAKLGQAAVQTPWDQSQAVAAVRAGSGQLLQVNGGCGAEGILSQVRRTDKGDVFIVLVNTMDRPIEGVELRLPAVGQLEELDGRTGKTTLQTTEMTVEGVAWGVAFHPLEERIFRFTVGDRGLGGESGQERRSFSQAVALAGPYRYELGEPNVLVLDRARFRMEGGEWRPETDILRIDEAVRDELGWTQRTGQMVQPWCADDQDREGPFLELAYSFALGECPAEVELVMEQPERWEIVLNRDAVSIGTDLEYFVDASMKRIKLPAAALRVGENQLCLRARLKPSLDLEAIYLSGFFGVYRKGAGFLIGALPEQVEVGDLVEQGFPFYTGGFTYRVPLPPGLDGAPAAFKLTRFAGACARVGGAGAGKDDVTLAFPPYEVECSLGEAATLSLEIILTRQNLFGPFHRLPKGQSFTGPESFRTRGEDYGEEHQLFPSGLLEAPILRI